MSGIGLKINTQKYWGFLKSWQASFSVKVLFTMKIFLGKAFLDARNKIEESTSLKNNFQQLGKNFSGLMFNRTGGMFL